MTDKSQVTIAQHLYNSRSDTYDDSWHPAFASWLVTEILQPQPGEKILDLACGTGLVTFAAAEITGHGGGVVGVDVTDGMLRVARQKLSSKKIENVQLITHDIADLGNCKQLEGQKGCFDAVTCVSALVLLREPFNALEQWREFLKPGGRIITDVTHERAMLGGLAFETAYKRLGWMPPHNRLWVKSDSSLPTLLSQAGFAVEYVTFKQQDEGNIIRRKEDGAVIWKTSAARSAIWDSPQDEEMKIEARKVFIEVWESYMDEDGRCIEVDGVYVVKARRADIPTGVELTS